MRIKTIVITTISISVKPRRAARPESAEIGTTRRHMASIAGYVCGVAITARRTVRPVGDDQEVLSVRAGRLVVVLVAPWVGGNILARVGAAPVGAIARLHPQRVQALLGCRKPVVVYAELLEKAAERGDVAGSFGALGVAGAPDHARDDQRCQDR